MTGLSAVNSGVFFYHKDPPRTFFDTTGAYFCGILKKKEEFTMIFTLGGYTLDIDVERTRGFYETAERITDGCGCQGCRNWAAWAGQLHGEPGTALEGFGIDLIKTPEVYVNGPNADGTLNYGGLYHLCGRLLAGPDADWWENGALVSLADRFRVGFSEEICLLEEGFPAPVIQLELLADIPLVLPEENSYL